jgi:hypothetical protein
MDVFDNPPTNRKIALRSAFSTLLGGYRRANATAQVLHWTFGD